MAGRASGTVFRVVAILCGLISLFTAVPFALLRGQDLPVQSEWIIFVIALGVVGVFSLMLGVLPRSRIAKLFHKAPEDWCLFSVLLAQFGLFAGIFYVVAVLAFYAPHTWNLNPQIMLAFCPMYFVKMTIDPSRAAIFLMLAPMNAAVYGSLGLTLRFAWSAFRAQH